MKKLLYTLTVMFSILSFTACDNDVKDKFDESSADRMSKALKEYQKILVDAPNGWLMEYYAGGEGDEMIGGYTYLCSFDKDGKVVVSSDLDLQDYPVGSKVESLYDLIAEQGPILSFNTNNALLHFFSTASGSKPKGYKGDYEFVLMEVTPEKIVMKGRRYENMIVMRPMSNSSWNDCLAKISTVRRETKVPSFELFVGGQLKGKIEVDLFKRRYTLVDEDVYFNAIYTTDGIRLYKSTELGGVTVDEFKWDVALKTYVSVGASTTVELKVFYPEGYVEYNEYLGSYKFKYTARTGNTLFDKTVTVTVEKDVDGESYIMKGFTDFDLPMYYDFQTGGLSLLTRVVGEEAGEEVLFMVWDTASGNINRSPDTGLIALLDSGVCSFEDNGAIPSMNVTAMVLYKWGKGWYQGGENQFRLPFTMTKQ